MAVRRAWVAGVIVLAGVLVPGVRASANPVGSTTTTNIVAVPNPSVEGQTVTITVTVRGVPQGPENQPPTGSVSIFMSENSCPSGLVCGTFFHAFPLSPLSQPPNQEQASFTATGLPPGTHYFLAVYGGDGTHAPSVSPSYGVTIYAATPRCERLSSQIGAFEAALDASPPPSPAKARAFSIVLQALQGEAQRAGCTA